MDFRMPFTMQLLWFLVENGRQMVPNWDALSAPENIKNASATQVWFFMDVRQIWGAIGMPFLWFLVENSRQMTPNLDALSAAK